MSLLRFSTLLIMLITAMPLSVVHAQSASAERPKIGLALSGGGARGAAHVGVLRVLESMHIPIDYVVGTSMGAIIGGLYASGMTPDEIEEALKSLEWEHIFTDAQPREDRSFRRKRDDDLYLVKAKPGYKNGELKFPTGAIQGQKFDLALRQLTLPVKDITDFDELYVPFRAVASDIVSGEPITLGSGDLATALRASMAVPGVFAATEIDGRLLVDGGITSNLPIAEVRAMGADIVIAVDISSPSLPAEEVTNFFKITGQLISIMTRRNIEQQIATLGEQDVLIVPKLGDFSSSNFVEATSLIPLGREAAYAQGEKLSALALPADGYQQYVASRKERPLNQVPVIGFIEIKNNSPIGDGMIRDRIHQTVGEELDREQLEQNIATIYGLELFQTVHYAIIEKNGESGLLIDASTRSWGPDYLQFGIKLSSNQSGKNNFDIGAAYLQTGINSLGGEMRYALQLGEETLFGVDWYQPLDNLSRYFIQTKGVYTSKNVNLYDDNGDERLLEFRVKEALAELAVGREFSVFGEFRVGYRYRNGEVELETGVPSSDWLDYNYESSQLYARLSVDRIDNVDFPSRGWFTLVEYDVAREEYGSDSDVDQILARANHFTTIVDDHVLGVFGSVAATLDGQAAVEDRFDVGGFLNLSGFAEGALTGQQKAVVGTTYYKRTEILPFLSWYVGGSIEHGGVWEEKSEIFDGGITSGSIFVGAETPVGPLYMGYGHAESGVSTVFFSLGRPQHN